MTFRVLEENRLDFEQQNITRCLRWIKIVQQILEFYVRFVPEFSKNINSIST